MVKRLSIPLGTHQFSTQILFIMPVFDAAVPVCALLAVMLCLKRFVSLKSQKLPLPPGPPRVPILGNLLDWPWEREWETWAKWGRQYGDIIYTSVGTINMIILNSVEEASKTLGDKASIYSDRPRPYFASEQIGWKDMLTFIDDGPRVRAIRRLLLQELGTRAALARFEPITEDGIQHSLRKILHEHSPEKLFQSIRLLFGSIILEATYGYQAKDEGDELLALVEQVITNVATYSRPGAVLVDVLPWIKWLPSWMPGTGYRELGRRLKEELMASRDAPYAFTQRQMATGMHGHSFVASHIEGQELSAEDEAMLKNAALVMYGAGAETTVSTALSFMLFMTLYPEVQARAQAEIDSVVGSTRLLKLSDRDHLPYLNAIISEVI